jgi:hypothetical protein
MIRLIKKIEMPDIQMHNRYRRSNKRSMVKFPELVSTQTKGTGQALSRLTAAQQAPKLPLT